MKVLKHTRVAASVHKTHVPGSERTQYRKELFVCSFTPLLHRTEINCSKMEKKKEVITQFDRQTGCTMKMFNDGTKITAQLPSQCCESIIVSKNKITAVPETETSSQVSICKKTSIKVKL